MRQSLRSILGRSNRVKKRTRPAQRRRNATSTSRGKAERAAEEDEAFFQDKLSDVGISPLLEEELTLRDVVQAMRYIRSRMFTPVPATGLKSTRAAEVLNYRLSTPPMVTLGHLEAVLSAPTRTEREVVELMGRGVVRKVRVERRGGMGEGLMESSDFEDMVRKSDVSDETADRFVEFLRAQPTSQTLSKGELANAQADELVRAGFLTSSGQATPGNRLDVRPEDRTTLTSIQHVSRFASGTVSAVGGANAVRLAGGGGGSYASASSASSASSFFRISVPGHGRYLKLAEGAAVAWLRDALGRTRWGEGPESWVRERFEGGGLRGARWRQFWGVEWEWVLGQAVGLGVVEVFDTGSVGRGVRALGG
ncbi:Uncharacterized protein TCAP_00759 [Tolypocladium capitatum]|uniref:Serine-threonine protein kinase 19 n=1 Tax=Tolypocladium capitatum TaxID=45235 RepID=A0A2K3QP59_9HYPO|nr:Uncharacterized protein TCAP_00759 [Tolypocladium capitatum]